MLNKEFIKPLGMTQQAFADVLGIDRPALNMIINGRRRISPEMAVRLSIVLGTTPDFWLNGQMICDLYETRRSPLVARLRKQLRPLRKRQKAS
ncbi:MAG: HigA family addiction module antidote protein [Candidatus Eremiobacteraeota bacterium]|nr:HigA family addiction module antidote protein [Candidatus Eremiobacteraeota bacterium]